jgi:hypothetical protein
VPTGAAGNVFVLLGLAPGDRVTGVAPSDEAAPLPSALEQAARALPSPATLRVERGGPLAIHLIPVETQLVTKTVAMDREKGSQILEQLHDELIASATMHEDVRKRRAAALGEVRDSAAPVRGIWLIAAPQSPDLGLAALDRIVSVNGVDLLSVQDLVELLSTTAVAARSGAPQELVLAVERGQIQRFHLKLVLE